MIVSGDTINLRLDALSTVAGTPIASTEKYWDVRGKGAVSVQWDMLRGTKGATQITYLASNDGSRFWPLAQTPTAVTDAGNSGVLLLSGTVSFLMPAVTIVSGVADEPTGQFTLRGV